MAPSVANPRRTAPRLRCVVSSRALSFASLTKLAHGRLGYPARVGRSILYATCHAHDSLLPICCRYCNLTSVDDAACHYRATSSNVAGHRQIQVSVRLRYMIQNVGYRMSGSSIPNQDNGNENVHRAKPGTASALEKAQKRPKTIIFPK